jgi:tRNA A37 methylthiotransferase MiaB
LGSVTRKFLIRTFGCQMNEHDSERLAGLLEADGMEATDDLASADVVVLNTCCIRENADNRLYGHLGHLKAEKDRRPSLQIAVGGAWPRRTGAWCSGGHRRSTPSSAPTTSPPPPSCCAEPPSRAR